MAEGAAEGGAEARQRAERAERAERRAWVSLAGLAS